MLLGEAVVQHHHICVEKKRSIYTATGFIILPIKTLGIKAPLYTLMFKVFSSILGKAQSKETLFAIWVHYQVNVNGFVSELENGQDRIAL